MDREPEPSNDDLGALLPESPAAGTLVTLLPPMATWRTFR